MVVLNVLLHSYLSFLLAIPLAITVLMVTTKLCLVGQQFTVLRVGIYSYQDANVLDYIVP